jgi:hypothetical protein
MKVLAGLLMIVSCGLADAALARDELVTSARTPTGETIPYVLTSNVTPPAYAVILMPGGAGRLGLPTQRSRVHEINMFHPSFAAYT